jgi:hypothetical protein
MDQDFFRLEGIEHMLCPLPFATSGGELEVANQRLRGAFALRFRWLDRESHDPSPSLPFAYGEREGALKSMVS